MRPWENEPDRKDWEAYGFPCVVNRDSLFKSLCGYVGLPKDHPWYGKKTEDLYGVDVHGCVSFSDPGNREFFGDKADWWVGFDCGHSHDLKPYTVGTDWYDPFQTYRTFSYTVSQTEELARQAAEAMKEDPTNEARHQARP